MFRWIAGFPGQLRATADAPGLAAVRPLAHRPNQVLVCGMGGSAMAGSLLADGWPGLEVPVFVHRDDGLPSWAGPETLVLACSFSGETAETLAAVAEAQRRGCSLAAVTSGGRLLGVARGDGEAQGFPVVVIPGGQPPRTALGASLGAQLHLLSRLGVLPDPGAAIDEACTHVESGRYVGLSGQPAGDEAAERLAASLVDRFSVVFTSGGEAHGAGRRLLAQLQENAKASGHVAVFPELNHNEIVGWNSTPAARDGYALVVLRGADESATAARRVDVALELLADQFAVVHQVRAMGPGRLARMLGLILFADLVSTHLAVHTGTDPVPITRIDALKTRLTDGPSDDHEPTTRSDS